jgi:TPR repeat protein
MKQFFITTIIMSAALVLAAPLHAADEDQTPEAVREAYMEQARAGNTDAQYKIARSFCCDSEEEHNVQRATWWYCDAARKNHKDSQFMVGEIYRSDRTVTMPPEALQAFPQLNDDVLAYAWLKIADKNGHPDAKAKWQEVKKKLSGAKLREAESMIPFYPQIPCEIEVGDSEGEKTQQAAGEGDAEKAAAAAPAAGE